MHQTVIGVLLLAASSIVIVTQAKVVTQRMEDEMRADLRERMHTDKDENGFRWQTAAWIRACFHDCVMGCDGCIDTRRIFQSSNNGLENIWKPMKALWERKYTRYCSRADFFALGCVVAVDYTAQRGEQEGTCVRSSDEPNDCRPNMNMLWGRRTCEHAQRTETRNIPNADENPYKWFAINMGFTPRESVCVMGSHGVGKLRNNETGFQGDYTTKLDVMDNEYFKIMLEPNLLWTQNRYDMIVDGFNETRHQWDHPDKNLTRVNSDFQLLYNISDINPRGKVKCVLPPQAATTRFPHCPLSEHAHLVLEMANDNKAFLKCFGEAMDKMVHTGYRKGELVPTGVNIPPPPANPITFTQPPTTTTSTTSTTTTSVEPAVTLSRAEKRRQRQEKRRLRKLRRGGNGNRRRPRQRNRSRS